MPRKRKHTAVIAAGVALVVGLVVLVIVLASGEDEDAGGGRSSRSGGGYDDLGRSVDDPKIFGRGTGTADGPGTGSGTSVAVKQPRNPRNPRGSGGGTSGQQTGPGTGAGTGKTELVVGPEGGVEPLTPDDVVAQAQRNVTGTQRCYERALKKDPFINVKSIAAVVSIDRSGKVSEVTLDQMQSEPLGQCLVAAIKRWSFRKSTEGIDTKITLKFEQTLGP